MEEGAAMVTNAAATREHDDLYAINVGKTKIGDAYDSGNVSLLDNVLDGDFVNFSDSEQCWFGEDGIGKLKRRISKWHADYRVRLEVIIIEIRLIGDAAIEYGWQTLKLEPKSGGRVISKRERYVDVWQRRPAGWRLVTRCTNLDVPDSLTSEL